MRTLSTKNLMLIASAIAALAIPSTAFAQFGGEGRIQIVGNSGTSISVTNVNGVKTTKINDNGKLFEILENADDGITVKLTKTYGPDDVDKLKVDYPDLFMHVSAFPTETEGATVELNVNLKKEYKAQNVDDLKEKHPEAFEVYEKYSNKGIGPRVIDGRFRKGGAFKLKVLPEGKIIIEKDGKDQEEPEEKAEAEIDI